jgi:hypothetical protein
MNAEETESVEVQTSQAGAQASEAERQEPPIDAAQHRKRNDLEYNWAEARKGLAARDKEILELKNQMQSLMQPKTADPQLSDDDLLTAKDGRKVFRQEAADIVKEAIKQYEASTLEERLVQKYPDFNEVVSPENIKTLKETEPELAMSIAYLQDDPKAQSIAAYKLLKKLGIGAHQSSPEKEKALKNAQKPLSVNAVTRQSAIGNAHLFENGLTTELKSQLWKEMQDCMKRA